MPDSSLVSFCSKLADSCSFTLSGTFGGKVEFQFPPKILSDSNSSEWFSVDIWSIEPLMIHKGSSGRKVDMEWEYVATDRVFNATKVKDEVSKLKKYFFAFNGDEYPIARINYTLVLPNVPMRILNLNVTHGPEIINNGGYYPLYTKVSVALMLATNVSNKEAETIAGFMVGDIPKHALAPHIASKDW
jgi:hypothetical protein